MWTRLIVFGVLLFFFSPDIYAARCKVDGKWYSYDSPECSPNRTQAVESSQKPPAQRPDELTDTNNSTQQQSVSPDNSPNSDAPYLRPWPEVEYLTEKYCKEREQFMRFRSCMLKEENSYWAMRGNFDMPEQVAVQSKALCISKTSSFLDQARCMEEESMGFDQFSSKSELPDQLAEKERDQCRRKFVSWSQRSRCLSSAVDRYKNPNGKSASNRPAPAAAAYIVAPAGYAKESEVVTFRVRPSNLQKRSTFGKPPPKPVPLSTRQRAIRMAQDAADPDVLMEAVEVLETQSRYTVFGPEQLEVPGVGFITLSWPARISASNGVFFTEEDDSSLGILLDVEVGRVYLLDFLVWGVRPGSYELSNGSDKHIFEDIGPSLEHVIARLVVEESGKFGFTLKHLNGKGFFFYAVTVTDVAATGVFAPPALSATDVSQSASSGGL